MKAHQATHPVRVMCRLLRVSPSGFYAWLKRGISLRKQMDLILAEKICEIHRVSKGTYGAPRIHAELARSYGLRVGRKRVARLMRERKIQGVKKVRWLAMSLGRYPQSIFAPDLVKRDFKASEPDRLWVADITYIPAGARYLYLAVVIDAWSRRVIGWAMAPAMPTGLVMRALNMALAQRRHKDVIHHSDRGVQYTSVAFTNRCSEMGVRRSMGSSGNAYDNAMCESFFATLKRELLTNRKFKTPTEARSAIFEFIEGWYNPRRRHSALNYLSPSAFERSASLVA